MAGRSPWIAQLNKKRPIVALHKSRSCDVVIVGAGIAGITTAYYLLKDTNVRVVLIDAHKIAHGATGHNAGQIVSEFEHSFSYLAKKYGVTKAASAQRSVQSAWDLLDHIVVETRLKHKPVSFAGFYGMVHAQQILHVLDDMYHSHAQHLHTDYMYIAKGSAVLRHIPPKYEHLYSVVEKKNILEKLKTNDARFIAARTHRRGVMNSAKFCEELILFMHKRYGARFSLYEKSPVDVIDVRRSDCVVYVNNKHIACKDVVLCTNGFTAPPILYKGVKAVRRLQVHGVVGYMCAYERRGVKDPTALSYDTTVPVVGHPALAEPYMYVTRRKFTPNKHLVCVGGPEHVLPKGALYDYDTMYVKGAGAQVQKFLHKSYKDAPKHIDFDYEWEGVMGYTKNGLRMVGRDPVLKQVYYNIGCNGIGILTSVFGSKRISLLMQGKRLKETIFDVV